MPNFGRETLESFFSYDLCSLVAFGSTWFKVRPALFDRRTAGEVRSRVGEREAETFAHGAPDLGPIVSRDRRQDAGRVAGLAEKGDRICVLDGDPGHNHSCPAWTSRVAGP